MANWHKVVSLWGAVVLLAGLSAAVIGVGGVYWVVHASLPQVKGQVTLPGLERPVIVVRDDSGTPTVQAADSLDAWRVLGYLEAQDRFFQMDILRRLGGGDLAALLGKSALPVDLRRSRFGLRKLAEHVYLNASPQQKARLEAFSLGVNEGLQNLGAKPWPYWILGVNPKPWAPSDCILVLYALGFMLHSPWKNQQLAVSHLRALYPRPVFRFLMAPDVHWAAPLVGSVPTPATIPGTAEIDLHTETTKMSLPLALPNYGGAIAVAVAGEDAAHDQPLVSAAPTLALTNPPLWYRARLEYRSVTSPGKQVVLTGVFVPGVPFMMAGNNGYIAWSLTGTGGERTDLVRVRIHRSGQLRYKTPSGSQVLTERRVLLKVRGEHPVRAVVSTTIWGPVIGWSRADQAVVAHWALVQPGGMNLKFMSLARAHNVSDALVVAQRSGIPEENFVVADHAGNIGWTIAGRIPRRISGCNYSIPESWSNGKCGWRGWLSTQSYPAVVNPKGGYLVVGENRVDTRAKGAVLGLFHFADGAVVHQIVGKVNTQIIRGHPITAEQLFRIQLGEKAIFMQRWKTLALSVLRASALKFHSKRRAFKLQIEHWSGKATVNSVGYRLIRDFRINVAEAVFAPILGKFRHHYPTGQLPFLEQMEGPLWALVSKRPMNWLNSRFPTWNALFLYAIDRAIAKLWVPGSGFSREPWGDGNQVTFSSPYGFAWGPLAPWLRGPRAKLPGGRFTPRVQMGKLGASYRLVVSPGDVSKGGILEVAGGQTDNPLSIWYRGGLQNWIAGTKVSLSPGKAQYRLRFNP